MNYLGAFLSVILVFTACSSPAEKSTANTNIANANANSDIASNANSKMIPLEGVDANKFNANASDVPVANRLPTSQESIVGPRPAPDNSQNNTEMRPDGSVSETRTFKDHPELLKVERITVGTKVSLKVYLRNGKVIEVPKEKIPEFQVVAPGNILLAAGIKPPVVQPTSTEKKGEVENEISGKPD
jgi:hypothetical protein